MRGLLSVWIVGVSAAATSAAFGAPGPAPVTAAATAAASYQKAEKLDLDGDYEHALAAIEDGLARAPKDLPLLGLKGKVLFEVRDYVGSRAAYQAYLDAGVSGGKRRSAEKSVALLSTVTFLDIELPSGPAAIYLDSKSQGVLCTAAPTCHKLVLPGRYKVIAERSGFERWTGSVTITQGTPAKLAVALVEKPSALTVRATPPEAKVTIDDAAYDPAAKVAPGSHQVTVAQPGHSTVRRQIVAHEGQPIDLDVSLAPLVAVRIAPASARVLLDGAPLVLEDGGLALPPGKHVLVARAPGFVDRTLEIPADRPADFAIAFALDRVAVVVRPEAGGWSTRRKVALAAGGVSVVALAGGIAFGVHSQHLANDALALCPSPSTPCAMAAEANDLSHRGRSSALIADVAYGAAGGAAIAAAVLWLTGAQESRVAVTPKVGPVVGLNVAVGF